MNVKVNPNRCPYCGFRLSHTWACPNAPRVKTEPKWVGLTGNQA